MTNEASKKAVSLKDRWNSKGSVNTTKFTFLGQEVEIKELTGFEKDEIAKVQENDPVKAEYRVWELAVLTDELKLTENEFMHAYETSHAEVDYVLTRILKFSCLDAKSIKDAEKN